MWDIKLKLKDTDSKAVTRGKALGGVEGGRDRIYGDRGGSTLGGGHPVQHTDLVS